MRATTGPESVRGTQQFRSDRGLPDQCAWLPPGRPARGRQHDDRQDDGMVTAVLVGASRDLGVERDSQRHQAVLESETPMHRSADGVAELRWPA